MQILPWSSVTILKTSFYKRYRHKGIRWINTPFSFDIETSSWIDDTDDYLVEKCACMYIWQFAVGTDYVFYGRTWDDFNEFINQIIDILHIDKKNRIIIYVHNLSYEFQFIRKYFEWDEMLCISERKPIKCCTSTGLEFRCSYLLTNSSLALLCKNYGLKYSKTDGLDYTKIRNSCTPLTDEELEYCVNDVLCVNEYIQILINEYGKIDMIPNTSTGFVRNHIRTGTIALTKNGGTDNGRAYRYIEMIKQLTLETDEFRALHRAFQGGHTHCNAHYMGKELHFMRSKDISSSYPYVMMTSDRFPMSKGKHIGSITDIKEINKYISTYACVMDVVMLDVSPAVNFEHIISVSQCYESVKVESDNGKVVSAKYIKFTCTELDLEWILKFYKCKSIIIDDMWVYKRGYLPKQFVKHIIKLYNDKTSLKGVAGEELNYLSSKQKINSAYGMCVTSICRPHVIYDGEWKSEPCDENKEIKRYNEDKSRFLYYPWGVYVTALARHHLFEAIWAMADDYVYADTDSVKYLNPDRHEEWWKKHNTQIVINNIKVCEERGFNPSDLFPKTITGIVKPPGVFEDDCRNMIKFKTLGAKRYMYLDKDGYHLTVAGLSKSNGMKYIERTYVKPFEAFNMDLYIPPKETGKMTHTYIDDETIGTVTDYLGNTAEYHELSSIHLQECDYDFSISQDYLNYILRITEREMN